MVRCAELGLHGSADRSAYNKIKSRRREVPILLTFSQDVETKTTSTPDSSLRSQGRCCRHQTLYHDQGSPAVWVDRSFLEVEDTTATLVVVGFAFDRRWFALGLRGWC